MPQVTRTRTPPSKRKAEHIEQGYEHKGVPAKEAEARASATVDKQDGGGKQSGWAQVRLSRHRPLRLGNDGRASPRAGPDQPEAGNEHRPRRGLGNRRRRFGQRLRREQPRRRRRE